MKSNIVCLTNYLVMLWWNKGWRLQSCITISAEWTRVKKKSQKNKVLRDCATLLMYVEFPLLQNSELCSCHILFAFCYLQAVTNCCFRHFLARFTTYFTARFRKWYFSICQAIYQVRDFQISSWEFIINTILNF